MTTPNETSNTIDLHTNSESQNDPICRLHFDMEPLLMDVVRGFQVIDVLRDKIVQDTSPNTPEYNQTVETLVWAIDTVYELVKKLETQYYGPDEKSHALGSTPVN